MDKDTGKSEEVKVCPKCHGTGFDKPGHICDCISGTKEGDLPKILRDIFGVRK